MRWCFVEKPDTIRAGSAGKAGPVGAMRCLYQVPLDRGVGTTPGKNGVKTTALTNIVMCMSPDQVVRPSVEDNYALHCAASQGHMDVVRHLCELPSDRGVDPSARRNDTIRMAASHGHMDVVRYLCELPPDRGVDPSAAIVAAGHRNVDVVRYLCELPPDRGVDPSAVIVEAGRCNVDVVRYLCSYHVIEVWTHQQEATTPSALQPGTASWIS